MKRVHARTIALVEELREHAAAGLARKESALLLGISKFVISYHARTHGIEFKKKYPPKISAGRSDVMATLYRDGQTLEQIGKQFGVTRERVRQILKRAGITASDGGQSLRAKRNAAERAMNREQKCLSKHGCSTQQFESIPRKARLAFGQQRHNAIHGRKIGWELGLWQWWSIWQQSGKWEERGRGQGYVMCRRGDKGAYALGNVFIASGRENSSEGNKKCDLPLGVTFSRSPIKPFKACRCFAGTTYQLGNFETIALARAAYLSATPESVKTAAKKKRGTSKYKGVCRNKKTSKWTAQIQFGGVFTHLGSYETEELAAAAYAAARARLVSDERAAA